MRTLTVWTIKGGVGKTAAAVNLAYLCARSGQRTLLWDLDAQGAASFYFRIEPHVKGGGRAVLRRSVDLQELARGTDVDNLDLVPADFSYRHLDLELDARKAPQQRLALKLAQIAEEYDWAILDCPPSVSLTSESVLRASDALLVPVIPTTLSLRTLEQVRGLVTQIGGRGPLVLPFLSMVDRRRKLHLDVWAECARQGDFLQTVIPSASVVEQMGLRRQPVVAFAARSEAAQAFVALWDEVSRRVPSTAGRPQDVNPGR
jgi:chromosome partitioning protein